MLDELEREGYIKKLPEDKKKVEDALNLAKRDVKVAKTIIRENEDWAFSIAYNAMLQAIRALMFSKGYRTYGNSEKKVSSILDIGCGTGSHALPFADMGYAVTGVDISEDMLEIARKKASDQKIFIKKR